jgi:cell division protein FtsI/penicillin-binding protein 2
MGAFAQEDEWFVAVAPADAPRVVLVVHAPAPPHGAERAALGILRAWHRLSSEHP